MTFESLELVARRIRDEKFEVIFEDAAFPGLGLQSFTGMVRKSKFNSQVPIVLLTGYGGAGAVRGEVSDGVSLMVKPTSPADVLPLLKEVRGKIASERRKHRRLPYRTTVNCVDGLRRFRTLSVNLSATGLLLEVTSPPERGSEFEIHFLLDPGDPVFRARVRVVRRESPTRVALTFQNLEAMERQRLRQFLDQHLPTLR